MELPRLSLYMGVASPGLPQRTLQDSSEKEQWKGRASIFVSTIGFSLASVLIKLDKTPSGQTLPAAQIACGRALVGLFISVPLILAAGLPILPNLSKKALCIALLRGALEFIVNILFYFACAELPIAVATIIFFTNPIFAGLFARLLFSEPYSWRHLSLSLLALCGVALAVWPEMEHSRKALSASGLIAAVLGSPIQAAQYVAGRLVGAEGLHFLHASLCYSIAGMVIGPMAILLACAFEDYRDAFVPLSEFTSTLWSATCGIILSALCAQSFLIIGMRALPASMVATIRTLDIPMALVWAWALLPRHVLPNVLQVIASCIVMASCILFSRMTAIQARTSISEQCVKVDSVERELVRMPSEEAMGA